MVRLKTLGRYAVCLRFMTSDTPILNLSMMRKLYLSILGTAVALTQLQAQSGSAKLQSRDLDLKSLKPLRMQELMHRSFNESFGRNGFSAKSSGGSTAANQLPITTFGTRIGITNWDYQGTGALTQRVIQGRDGGISVVFVYGRRGVTNNSSSGYNRLVNGQWQWDDFEFPGSDTLNLYVDVYQDLQNVNRPAYPRVVGDWGARSFINLTETSIHRVTTGNRVSEMIAGDGFAAFYASPDSPSYRMPVQYYSGDLARNIFRGRRTIPSYKAVSIYTRTAAAGSNIYTVTPLFDLDAAMDTANTSLTNNLRFERPLQFNRSLDSGRTFQRSFLPYLNAASGMTSARFGSVTIDAKDNTVVVALMAFRRHPTTGAEIVYLRSDDRGAPGSWRYKVVAAVAQSDTFNTAVATSGTNLNFVLSDGCLNVTLDNNNNAHLIYGRGLGTTDLTGYDNFSYFMRGGAPTTSNQIMYWNDTPGGFDKKAEPIAGAVDLNRNGAVRLLPSSDPAGYGNTEQGYVSYGNLSVDANNHLYLTYSSVVEGSEQGFGSSKQTRDIYVAYSTNGGAKWSNPLNVAPLLLRDDISGGGASTDDVYPYAIKRIGSDNTLHMIWQSDAISGLATNSANNIGAGAYSLTAATDNGNNWRINNILYAGIPVANIKGQFIEADLPSELCVGQSFAVNYTAPEFGYPEGNQFYVQIDRQDSTEIPAFDVTTFGDTNGLQNAGFVTSTQRTGTIYCQVPYGFRPGRYRIRVRSSITNYDIDLLDRYPDGVNYPRPTAQISSEQWVNVEATSPDFNGTPSLARINASANAVCPGTSLTFRYPTNQIRQATSVTYALVPDTAGTLLTESALNENIIDFDDLATVILNPNFRGHFYVIARTSNGCGTSEWLRSDSVLVAGPSISFNPANFQLTVQGGTAPFSWFYNPDNDPTDNSLAPTTANIAVDPDQRGLYEAFDANGCRSTFLYTGNDQLPVGTVITSTKPGITLASRLVVYPNPAKSTAFVALKDADKAAQVQVLNSIGQVVVMTETSAADFGQVAQINTGVLAKGVYLVRVISEGKMAVRKLAVE